MWSDPLVEEIRRRRRELMAEFDYNPKKFIKFLKGEKDKYSNRLVQTEKKRKAVARIDI